MILHLIDSGGLYGAEKMLIELCKEQQSQGYDVRVLSCGIPNEPEKAIEAALSKENIDYIAWRMAPGFSAKMDGIWDYIYKNNINVLHSHGYKFNVLLALSRSKSKSISLVTTIHGYTKHRFFSKGWLYNLMDKTMCCLLDAVVSVNENYSPPVLVRPWYGSKLHFVNNGIGKPPAPRIPKLDPVKKLLLVGRISTEKGHAIALDALSVLLNQQHNDFSLTFAGTGPLEKEIKDLAKEMGLSNKVSFLGYVNNVHEIYKDYDAIVMPSLTEGLPITLLEANREMIPIFASRVGAIPKILNKKLLVDTGSSQSLANAISQWNLMQASERKDILTKQYSVFETHYSADVMAKRYINLYRSLNQGFEVNA